MNYKVIITEDEEADRDDFVYYLLSEKKNERAALSWKQESGRKKRENIEQSS